jgi:hypothetical protein
MMQRSRKTMVMLLALAMILAIIQPAGAQDTLTVVGTVQSVNTAENSIVVDTGSSFITLYCIPYDYLANKCKIYPAEGDSVTIEYYVRTFSDGTTKNLAITYNGISLPGSRLRK